MSATLFDQQVDMQNNSMQNVDQINNLSGGDVRFSNSVVCKSINATSSIMTHNAVRIDSQGDVFARKVEAVCMDVKGDIKAEICTIGLIQTNKLETNTVNMPEAEFDRAGNLSCVSGNFAGSVSATALRTSGVTRIDGRGNVFANIVSSQSLCVVDIKADSTSTSELTISSGLKQVAISSSETGFIAITPLGSDPALPSTMTSNETIMDSKNYITSDSIGSSKAFLAFNKDGLAWDCHVIDGYGFFGSYDGQRTTLVGGKRCDGEWLQLTLPEPKGIMKYSLSHDDLSLNQRPKSWTLAGSRDGVTFFPIHKASITKLTDPSEEYVIPSSSVTIQHFRLIVTEIFPFNGNHAHGRISISNIDITVGFGKNQVRQPREMLDVYGSIACNGISVQDGQTPIKFDAGRFASDNSETVFVKFNVQFPSLPSVVVTPVSDVVSFACVTFQTELGFFVKQFSRDGTPVSVSINWVAIG